MAELEERKDAGSGDDGKLRFWRENIRLAGNHEQNWRKRAKKVIERYRDEEERTGKRFNILWSNIETLKPPTYSNTPEPDVRRRYLDNDPTGREAAEILERALSHTIDSTSFDETMEAVRDDALLVGRGWCIWRLNADIVRRADIQVQQVQDISGEIRAAFMLDGAPVQPEFEEDGTPFLEELADQTITPEFINWSDLRLMPAGARRMDEVRAKAIRHSFTRRELVDLFGSVGKEIKLADTKEKQERADDQDKDQLKRAEVWEIWDAEDRKRLWISDGLDRVIEEEVDPLGLEGFFPGPEPLYFVKTNDTLIPLPEFTLYQDQADELDEVSWRIHLLTKALKARGAYAGKHGEIQNVVNGDEAELVPLDDWNAIQQGGGLEKLIAWMPIKQIADTLVALHQRREVIKQEIFEIIGISDIIRGSSDAKETATAQRIKGNFGSLRMQPRQKPMARFVRDFLRIGAELIAEHFEPEQLQRITGRPVNQQVIELLRDDKLRGFRVDIETDSTVQPDAETEKAQVIEFTGAVTQYLGAASELVNANPQLAPMLFEMLKFTIKRFKVGRTLEDVIDRTAQQITQQLQQPQQQQPDPRLIEAQGRVQTMQQKAESDIQVAQFKAQSDVQIQAQKMQTDAALQQQGQETDVELAVRQQNINAELERRRMASEAING